MENISLIDVFLGGIIIEINHGCFGGFLDQKLTNFRTRFWTRDTCHVGSADTIGKPLSSR